jgi:hypothetical protein
MNNESKEGKMIVSLTNKIIYHYIWAIFIALALEIIVKIHIQLNIIINHNRFTASGE